MKQIGRYPDLFFGFYLYRPRPGFKKLLNKTRMFSNTTSFSCIKGFVLILSGLRAFVNVNTEIEL